MKKLLLAAAAGAALMWFYDPANGTQRREALQRKMNRVSPDQARTGPLSTDETLTADVAVFAAG
jgi:hypothetical protein